MYMGSSARAPWAPSANERTGSWSERFKSNPLGYRHTSGRYIVPFSKVRRQRLGWGEEGPLVARWLYRAPWPRGAHVHHRDGDYDNNRWDNLIFPLLREEHLLLEGKTPRQLSLNSPYYKRLFA